MLIPYAGKSEYCYANSLHMSLVGAGADARDLPEVGFLECLAERARRKPQGLNPGGEAGLPRFYPFWR
jgi:hypothetical protein